MTKYQKYFNQMWQENEKLFEAFAESNKLFAKDRSKYQADLNQLGNQVLAIVKKWEIMLCSQTIQSSNSRYATNLSEKFWAVARKCFPYIDLVGLTIRKA